MQRGSSASVRTPSISSRDRRGTIVWAAWCVVFLALTLTAVGLAKAYPGDEYHFIETSQLFSKGLSLDLLRSYPEMSGPLPFALFGFWGSVFGWSLPAMRAFALLIAFGTLMLLHLWLRDPLAQFFICLNPYVVLMSVFLYTDMISVFFVLAAILAAERRSAWLTAGSLCAALLCRQYLVYVVLAMLLHFAFLRDWKMVAAVALSFGPLAALTLLWGGLAPVSPTRTYYLSTATSFHVSALVGYVTLLFLYLVAFLVMNWRALIPSRKAALIAAVVSLLYWAFPIRPSPSAVDEGLFTVGMVDHALHSIISSEAGRDTFYWLSFALGLLVLAAILRHVKQQPLLTLQVLCFLVVMPFSYLYWEKYFLPLLPVAAAAVRGARRC